MKILLNTPPAPWGRDPQEWKVLCVKELAHAIRNLDRKEAFPVQRALHSLNAGMLLSWKGEPMDAGSMDRFLLRLFISRASMGPWGTFRGIESLPALEGLDPENRCWHCMKPAEVSGLPIFGLTVGNFCRACWLGKPGHDAEEKIYWLLSEEEAQWNR